jgi:hypothetical protein
LKSPIVSVILPNLPNPRGTFGDADVERSPGDGGDGLHSLALQQMLLL